MACICRTITVMARPNRPNAIFLRHSVFINFVVNSDIAEAAIFDLCSSNAAADIRLGSRWLSRTHAHIFTYISPICSWGAVVFLATSQWRWKKKHNSISIQNTTNGNPISRQCFILIWFSPFILVLYCYYYYNSNILVPFFFWLLPLLLVL